MLVACVFFVKQKTAYEMRISDWSSDVCSSDLRFTSNDGSVFTRPYSMRGLPPDQTLVLVNGKRRHRGATVQLSNIPYIRGSQGPDLATIPSIAIGQLEVLRDGADRKSTRLNSSH